MNSLYTMPILLTAIRLTISPIILPLIIYYLLPFNIPFINACVGVLFLLICATDFFDGYLARRFNQVTLIGKLLDPLADKVFMTSTIISLVAISRMYFLWAIILIGREVLIMGIRQMASSYHITIPVSLWGKLKTTLQSALLFWIIINPAAGDLSVSGSLWNGIENVLLLLTLGLSIYSAYQYIKASKYMFQDTNN